MIVSRLDNSLRWWLPKGASSGWEAPATRIRQGLVFRGLRAALLYPPEFVVAEGVIMRGEFAHSPEGTIVLAAAVTVTMTVVVVMVVVVVVVAEAAAAAIVVAAVAMRVVVVAAAAGTVVAACAFLIYF